MKAKYIIENERKHHDTVDKHSSEQQFCKSDVITFVVQKFWSHIPSATGSYGRPAYVYACMQLEENLALSEIFKIL